MVSRILVLHASVGAGHERPARELARQLAKEGHRVRVVDLVTLTPGGAALRGVFRGILTRRPRIWGSISRGLDEGDGMPGALRALAFAAGRRLTRLTDRDGTDLVISTYPLSGLVMGQARLQLPLVTYVTDPAVHRYWLDDVTTRYLATWTFTADELRRRTATPVSLVAPALAGSFAAGMRSASRDALVASGSWAVGEVLATVRDVVADGRFRPVVVCGRNETLRAAVGAIPTATALGWVDDMAGLMGRCAVGILNSGGLTLAEAAAAGLPVVHHRPLPGQGELNAAACLAGAGMPVSWNRAGLPGALDAVRDLSPFLGRDSAVAAALEAVAAP